jgi:hypothetical protein
MCEASDERGEIDLETVARGLQDGGSVLVACPGSPPQDAIALRLLARYATGDDEVLVVTTTEGVDATVEILERVSRPDSRPAPGVVDTVSEGQSVSATHRTVPVVFTPAPGDLERLVVALADLAGTDPPSSGERHFVVRSLTPILEGSTPTQVGDALDRLTGLRSDGGLSIVGIDYTAHDTETVQQLRTGFDGVVWVTTQEGDGIDLEYEAVRGRRSSRHAMGESED